MFKHEVHHPYCPKAPAGAAVACVPATPPAGAGAVHPGGSDFTPTRHDRDCLSVRARRSFLPDGPREKLKRRRGRPRVSLASGDTPREGII